MSGSVVHCLRRLIEVKEVIVCSWATVVVDAGKDHRPNDLVP